MEFGPGDVRFFDRIAPLYDTFMPSARAEPLRRGLAFARRPVRRVLDLGGGTGRAARVLDPMLARTDAGAGTTGSETTDSGTTVAPATEFEGVVVVDRSREMLERARARGFDCLQVDATALPVASDAVDAVTVVDALHHVVDQRALVREAQRVVAPGGVVVVADFDPTTLRGWALEAVEAAVGFDSTFTSAPDVVRFLEREGFVARLVSSGFGYVVVGRVPDA